MGEACVGYDMVVFFYFFFEFLDETFIIFYAKISQIKCTKNGTPASKFCNNFQTFAKFPENFQKIYLKFSKIFSKLSAKLFK